MFASETITILVIKGSTYNGQGINERVDICEKIYKDRGQISLQNLSAVFINI